MGAGYFLCDGFFINTHYSGKFLKYPSWEQLLDILPAIVLTMAMGIAVFLLDTVLSGYRDILRLMAGALTGISFFLSLPAYSGLRVANLLRNF
ncbi:hypothetical protein LDL59_03545 [Kaistella anthropi]|nr:hypothetical protein [Kaistella anthropi]